MTDTLDVRPVILAGGRGTRLRPRTLHIPKPVLLVDGRPLLWHVLRGVRRLPLRRPIVAVSYKARLVESLLGDERVDFVDVGRATMLEAFFRTTEAAPAGSYLCLSSDVLMPPAALADAVAQYESCGLSEPMIVLSRLKEQGQKRWDFVIENGMLTDLNRTEDLTLHERVALFVDHKSVRKATKAVARPVAKSSLPRELHRFQTGWILLLKVLLESRGPIRAQVVDVPVVNVNRADDLDRATETVRSWRLAETVS